MRKPEIDGFLQSVLATSKTRHVEVKVGAVFWRARVDHDWREVNQDNQTFEVPCAYAQKHMKPLPDRATDGRVNPKGIPCLYLATQKETAIGEVRPWIGSDISMAQFKITRELNIVDCGRDDHGVMIYWEEPEAEEREKAVWSDINRAFSEPMTRSDDSADYVPTQIIAELFKSEGFDGIAYKSSFGETGYNVALFDLEAAELINCGLHRVDKISLETSEQAETYIVQPRDGNET